MIEAVKMKVEKNLQTDNFHGTEETNEDLNPIKIGQWYWVKDEKRKLFMCVMSIGSNYVYLETPKSKGSNSCVRVHFNDIDKDLSYCETPSLYINGKIKEYQSLTVSLMGKVQGITERLGMQTNLKIEDHSENENALVVLNSEPDIKGYENQLIKARDEDLPELFEQIKTSNQNVAKWMSAETMPLMAQTEILKDSTKGINNRIFNVSLYAGLSEDVVQCSAGEPANVDEKLRVMQRRLYMDEECILDYQFGGMDIQKIEEFDAWISKPKNRDRLLPFDRCVISMQVRRNTKERGNMTDLRLRVWLEDQDKLTFLYVRNGENIYRMNCELNFGEMIFPDKAVYDPSEKMMMKHEWRKVEFMSCREFEDRVKESKEDRRLYDIWEKENPDKHHFESPYSYCKFSGSRWGLFDNTNLYYDEAMEQVGDDVRQYNRIAVIIQGLFDRSQVLHPHLPVQTWKPDSFLEAIELVYDSSNVLHYGEAPDIQAYLDKCNETLDKNSVVIGQEDYWLRANAEKESERQQADWRIGTPYYGTHFQNDGDKGMGYIAKMSNYTNKRSGVNTATFSWLRERRDWRDDRYGEMIKSKTTVPVDCLFNVDAYQLGDYLQFFQDPRTRCDYLKWAGMLIAAEEYHMGLREAQEPVQ